MSKSRQRLWGSFAAVILTAALITAAAWSGPATAGQSQFAEFQGTRVHYLDVGQGPLTVIFIHGWSCDHTFWQGQIAEISRRYRVIALDLPGHGQSDKPRVSYTQDFLAKGVAAVMRRAGAKRAVLVGHSMGAALAWRTALENPSLAKAVVLVDGAFLDVPRETQAQIEAFLKPFKGPDYRDAVVKFIESMLGPAMTPELKKEIITKMLATPKYVGLSALENFADRSIWKYRPVEVPALAVYAQNDELPPDFEKFLQRMFPRLKYVLWQGVGHFFMMERPKRLNQELLNFFATLE